MRFAAVVEADLCALRREAAGEDAADRIGGDRGNPCSGNGLPASTTSSAG